MLGIMLTLVGANLLTVQLSPTTTTMTTTTTAIATTTTTSIASENLNPQKFETIYKNLSISSNKCNMNDFGCNRNLCWRSCVIKKNADKDYISWCFSTPKESKQNFHYCKNGLDCSPCWECAFPCVRKVCFLFFLRSKLKYKTPNYFTHFLFQ